MPRTLLLSTGTSIANGTTALRTFQRRLTTWDDNTDELRTQIRERLKDFNLATQADRVRASAELNILQRLPVHPDDQVVLFSTDTADGRTCSEELARVIRDQLGVPHVSIHRVEGLQVRDAETLRHTGLTNLLRLLIRYLDDEQLRYQGGCVLCPNGGFKGIVPFMSVLGMIFRAPVVYVFEFAEALISLPPVPITFATDLWERALPAMVWAKDIGIFDANDFYRRIPAFKPEETTWFDSFLEIAPGSGDGRLASLSPLASVLAEREISTNCLRLSHRAARDLEGLSWSDRREVDHHLSKLMSSMWRSQHRDIKPNNDLEFYPRGHNPWRFAGFTADDGFHLCWFDRHDRYLRLIRQKDCQRSAFPMNDFKDYSPPADSDAAANHDDPYSQYTWLQLRDQLITQIAINKSLRSQK